MKVSRLNSIEQYVISRETVSIDELCEVFGVSKNTIRRDLNELEQRGHITKVYGGVTATVPSGAVPTPIRSGLNQIDKSLIGRLAAEEVADGDTIFIDSGTTTLCLLRFLVAKKRITIITHSLGALSEASKIRKPEHHLARRHLQPDYGFVRRPVRDRSAVLHAY